MSAAAALAAVLAPDRTPYWAEADIRSVMRLAAAGHVYDRTAAFYDALVGNPLYNRVLWGNWPATYRAWCEQALAAPGTGPVLDVGCGTLVFTAEAYLRHAERPIILVDRSLGMLAKARARLLRRFGRVPEHLTLLQADLFDLPFRSHRFATVLSWGTLHLFDDPEPTLAALRRMLAEDGHLHLTSLVTGRPVGDRFLHLLHKVGEVATPAGIDALAARLAAAGLTADCSVRGNMAYCAAAPAATGGQP